MIADCNPSGSSCSLKGKRLDAKETTGRKGSQLFPLAFCTHEKYSVSLLNKAIPLGVRLIFMVIRQHFEWFLCSKPVLMSKKRKG